MTANDMTFGYSSHDYRLLYYSNFELSCQGPRLILDNALSTALTSAPTAHPQALPLNLAEAPFFISNDNTPRQLTSPPTC